MERQVIIMEWITVLQRAIAYMEAHLLEEINVADVAEKLHISPFYLQKGFKIMTGYSVGEYIRCRRLYLAALDILSGKEKVIETAYKYRYDTPESFTKAFTRFHGISPIQARKDASAIHTFLPLKISVEIRGGEEMDYVLEKVCDFRVIGLEQTFSFENTYEELPKFWEAFRRTYGDVLFQGKKPENALEQAVCDYHIGEYGVCIDEGQKEAEDGLRYLIAGAYTGGAVPEGMSVFAFPDMEWARFRCCGRMPHALQDVNTKIYREWLPGNPDYEPAMAADVEWYERGDMNAADYRSEIWLPVRRKKSGRGN